MLQLESSSTRKEATFAMVLRNSTSVMKSMMPSSLTTGEMILAVVLLESFLSIAIKMLSGRWAVSPLILLPSLCWFLLSLEN